MAEERKDLSVELQQTKAEVAQLRTMYPQLTQPYHNSDTLTLASST